MDTFNRLIRKAPPAEATLPIYASPAREQRLRIAPTPTELHPSFEAFAPSENHSALPPGEASQVGGTLLHQSQSPEWDEALKLEGVSLNLYCFGLR